MKENKHKNNGFYSTYSIIIEDKIFEETLQPNEVHSCYLKMSFDGNELPKGNIKLNLNIKYIFVQE